MTPDSHSAQCHAVLFQRVSSGDLALALFTRIFHGIFLSTLMVSLYGGGHYDFTFFPTYLSYQQVRRKDNVPKVWFWYRWES